MDHLGFVAAAYGITAFVMIGLTGWTVSDYLVQRKAVEAMERTGARRGRRA
jgi:heme exporter protein CcmD